MNQHSQSELAHLNRWVINVNSNRKLMLLTSGGTERQTWTAELLDALLLMVLPWWFG